MRTRSVRTLLPLLLVVCLATTWGQTFKGDFQNELRSPAGQQPFGMKLVDVNGDGKLDAIVANANGTVGVSLGLGDGTFAAPTLYTVVDFPLSVVIGDFNGDGKVDIAVTNYNNDKLAHGNVVSVLLGNGDGTFQAAVNYDVGAQPYTLVAGDFDGDGKLDLVTSDRTDGTVSFLKGNGDGTFAARVTSPAGTAPRGLAVGDFNGDGKLDLVVTNCPLVIIGSIFDCSAGPRGVNVLLGNGNGTFAAPLSLSSDNPVFAPSGAPIAVKTADLNGDGHADIVVTNFPSILNPGGGGVEVFLGNGNGTFQPSAAYPTASGAFASVSQATELTIADFDGDGKLDIVVRNSFGFTEYLGKGDGTFAQGVVYALSVDGYGGIDNGDLNGDGRADLAITGGSNVISTFLNANGLTRNATTLTLTISPSSSVQILADVNLTAKVSSAGPLPTGRVTFYLDGAPVDSNGYLQPAEGFIDSTSQAFGLWTLAAGTVTQGTHTITAVYSGDNNSLASSTTGTLTVSKIPTTLTCTSTPNPSVVGQQVTLSCFLSTPSAVPMGGSITFKDGTTVIGTQPVLGFSDPIHHDPNLIFTTSSLSVGTHSLSAVYSGSNILTGSTSNTVSQVVNPDFVMAPTAGASMSQTVTSGQNATYNITILPTGGFAGIVTFTCTGVPANGICTVPSSVNVNGSPVSITVNVGTVNPTVGMLTPGIDPGTATGFGLMLSCCLWFMPRPRKLRALPALFLVIVVSLLVFTGCAGGGSSSSSNSPPPVTAAKVVPGTYTLTLTGTAGGVSHTQTLTLVVTP